MFSTLKHYLKENLIRGLGTSPLKAPLKSWALVPFFTVFALVLGLGTGLFSIDPAPLKWAPLLFFGLLISPSLLEEIVFRGLMIPRESLQRGHLWVSLAIGWSTALYVLWHPLGALGSPDDRSLFLDPKFLIIVTALGITCGHSYVVSKSLWVPIFIHWLTVLVWVLLLGGHNLVLSRIE